MADFVDEKRREMESRLKELRPLVDESIASRPPSTHSPASAPVR